MKEIFFLCGMPRAGNTLLSSILNQNKDIASSGHTPLSAIFLYFSDLKKQDIYTNFLNEKSFNNLEKELLNNYYKDWKQSTIIDRGYWGKKGILEILKNIYGDKLKIIFLKRDLIEVLASFIDWSNKNKNSFLNKHFLNVEQKCNFLMDKEGIIQYQLDCYDNLIKPENKKLVKFIEYDNLIKNPEKIINEIYNFLNIKKFKHDFKKLNQLNINDIKYNDESFGDNLHTIKTKGITKTKRNIKDIIPKIIIDRYS
jgi:hypothetical protein